MNTIVAVAVRRFNMPRLDAYPSPARLHELREKHEKELENWWVEHFAHAFDALTESEARYLARTETADTVRNRIAAAEKAGNCATLP